MWWGFARKRVIFRFHQSTIFWVVEWPSQITTWAPLPHASQHPKLHTPSNVWASVGAWKGSKKKYNMLARFRLEELFEKKHQMTTEYSSIKIVTVRRFENILQRSSLPLPFNVSILGHLGITLEFCFEIFEKSNPHPPALELLALLRAFQGHEVARWEQHGVTFGFPCLIYLLHHLWTWTWNAATKQQVEAWLCMHLYIYIRIYDHMNIYIYREREKLQSSNNRYELDLPASRTLLAAKSIMFAQLGNLASKEYVQAPAESQTFTVAITAARLALGGKVLRAKKKRFGVPSHQLVAFQAKYSEYSNGATCCLLLGTAKSQSIPFVLIQIDIFHMNHVRCPWLWCFLLNRIHGSFSTWTCPGNNAS